MFWLRSKKNYSKCSISSNNIFFPAVRNFRNYVSEKVLVCVSKCGRSVLKTQRCDYALSTHFSFV